jgi:putative nucleotidyltransferase with HDIG domain
MLPIGWLLHRPAESDIPTLVYLAIGTQIAALRPIPWRTGVQTVADPLLIATGLFSPGLGVGLVAWLALFDGRVPGKSIPWYSFFFNRAVFALAHVLPSVAVASIGEGSWWGLPAKTAIYALASVGINYFLTAIVFSFIGRTSFWNTVAQNVGLSTLLATVVLSFAGGILYLLLQAQPFPVGYVIAPGLFGFVLAVRGNVADAQRQTLLKDQTLDLAAQALDARDRYTESHSIRVSELSGRLGEHLELGDREVELIRTAGSLHDLGKIGIRDDILNKPGPLSEQEWEIMRRHPDIGADMIVEHSALAEVAPIVRHHHERWDGTGYPAGLKGDVIPFGARILAVADSFDTITGARLYRPSLMTPIEGVEDISQRADHWYDPNVVDALRELHGLRPLEVLNRPEVPRRVTTLRVLRSNPGFSSLITAIGVSAIGDPLTQVATLVTIYLATSGDARLVALGFIVQALGTIVISSALGGVTDRLPRRRLVVGLELARATTLLATPFLISPIHERWWLIYPILLVLACINGVVQPARQAAIPSLVPAGQIGKANAIVAATTMLAGALGFALAGTILALSPKNTNMLFIADGMTFALAAAIVFTIPNLGGGSSAVSVSSALRRSWSIVAVRPHLVVGTLAAFFIPISFPALLALAYQPSIVGLSAASHGGQTYSTLELVLSLGIFVGSIAVARFGAIGTMRTVGAGLFVTGVFSLLIALSSSLPMGSTLMWIAVALFIASIGNPIYAVANQTAILEAADPSNRGSVMATRFGLVQTASIIGAAAGGLITKASGPLAAYGVIGVGLVLLALYAIAAGRSTTNPLHGAAYEEAYEEATLRTAGAQPQPKT